MIFFLCKTKETNACLYLCVTFGRMHLRVTEILDRHFGFRVSAGSRRPRVCCKEGCNPNRLACLERGAPEQSWGVSHAITARSFKLSFPRICFSTVKGGETLISSLGGNKRFGAPLSRTHTRGSRLVLHVFPFSVPPPQLDG